MIDVAFDINSLMNLGLPEIVLWLLSFALLYGILSQAKVPQSGASRMIISLVVAFFVLFNAPVALVSFLSSMTSSLVLVLVGILALVILLEVAQIRVAGGEFEILNEKGEPTGRKSKTAMTIFEKYGYVFFAGFLIIAALIFVNSGGLQLLGWNINLSSASTTTIMFFIFIILAVLWMVAEKKQKLNFQNIF